MPVYKTKRGYYARINYTNELGEYKVKTTKYFDTKREAVDAEHELAKNIKYKNISSSSITFTQAYDEYLAHKKETVKISTCSTYPSLWAHCEPLYNVKINKLTVPIYNSFKQSLNDKGLSVHRKNKVHNLIRQIVKYAKSMHDIHCDVFDKVTGFKDPNAIRVKNVDFYTFEEFQKFINCVDDPIYHTLFTLLYYQGLRLGEANALNWNDINFKEHTITINKTAYTKIKGTPYIISSTKKKASDRVLPLEEETERELINLKSAFKKYTNFSEDWFVFGGARPLGESHLHNIKNKAADKAGVKRIRIHDFRHSCASFLIELGCPPMTVQKYLGHANVSITLNTYSHLYPNKLEEAVGLIKKYKSKL